MSIALTPVPSTTSVVVSLAPDGSILPVRELPVLPPIERGVPVVLADADPGRLARTYERVRAEGGVPWLLHASTPLAAARSLGARAGAGLLVHAPDEATPTVVPLEGPRLSLETAGHLLSTSGTTGAASAPKVYFFDTARSLANARAHVDALGLGGLRRMLLPMPLGHAFGFVAGYLAAKSTGANLYAFASSPDPSTLLATMAREHVEAVSLTPPMVRLLLARVARRGAPPLPALRVIGVGSAPMRRDELLALLRAFPGARVYATYGLTECGPRVATFDAGTAEAPNPVLLDDGARPVPLGAPLGGVRLALAGEDDAGVGELQVTTPYLARGRVEGGRYVPLDGSRPWATCDAARRLPGGDVELLGRLDGTVVRGGSNVYPANVEPVALAVAGVSAACLVGRASSTYGEVPVLYCEVARGADADALLRALEGRFAAELAPTDRPVLVRLVESLPRTSLGKVRRGEVASWEAAHDGPR